MEQNKNSYGLYEELVKFIMSIDTSQGFDPDDRNRINELMEEFQKTIINESGNAKCFVVDRILEDHLDVMKFVYFVLNRVREAKSIDNYNYFYIDNQEMFENSSKLHAFDRDYYCNFQNWCMLESDRGGNSSQGTSIPVNNHNIQNARNNMNPHNIVNYNRPDNGYSEINTSDNYNQEYEDIDSSKHKGLLRGNKKNKKKEKEVLEEQLSELKQAIADAKDEVQVRENRLKQLQKQIDDKTEEYEEINRKCRKLDIDYKNSCDAYEIGINELKQKLEDEQSKYDIICSKKDEAEKQAETIRAEADAYISDKKKEADSFLQKAKEDVDVYLRRESELPKLDSKFVEEVENEARESRKRLIGISDGIASLQGNINENYRSMLDNLSAEFSRVQQLINNDLEGWRSDLFRREIKDLGMLYINMYAVYNRVVLDRQSNAFNMADTDDISELKKQRDDMKGFISDIAKQFRMICDQYGKALSSVGISIILPSDGDEFDPVRHINVSGKSDPHWIKKVITPGISMIMSNKNEDKIFMQAQVEAE